MSKVVRIPISNMVYTVDLEEDVLERLLKYLDLEKNNDTKELLAAYIRLAKEYAYFKEQITLISDKFEGA